MEELLEESYIQLDILEETLEGRRSFINDHDDEMEYLCKLMAQYVEDVNHTVDMKMTPSIVSHLTYNLILNLANGFTDLTIYCYLRGAYLLDDEYNTIHKIWETFREKRRDIVRLTSRLRIENYFIGEDDQVKFETDINLPICEHCYKRNTRYLNLQRRLANSNGNSLINILELYVIRMDLFLSDLKNGIYCVTGNDYDQIYNANYNLYKKVYWPKDGNNFRNHVLSSKPRFEVFNAAYLKKCLWDERSDFFRTPPGQIWREYCSDKKELYFGAKDIKMNEDQWLYFFKCICRFEEYEDWIDELEHPQIEGEEFPESEWDKIFKDAIDVKKVKMALQRLLSRTISITTWFIIYKVFLEIDWLQDSTSTHFILWVKDFYGWKYKTEDFKTSVNNELKQQHTLDWDTRTMTSAKKAKDYIDFANSIRKEFVSEMDGKTVIEDNRYYFKRPDLYISHPRRQ